mmetsp:Transcript_113843/g.332616  ORF Transcript_113843/g.332616 Transcript_113843/m.332616 type:complete len:219 (+) Transcript_113843:173-829(+)
MVHCSDSPTSVSDSFRGLQWEKILGSLHSKDSSNSSPWAAEVWQHWGMMPASPRRPPPAHAAPPGASGPLAASTRRLHTRKVSRGTWMGSSKSAFTRSSASTTSATIAVVSSALPPGFSRREASQGGSSIFCSNASILTLRIAASTSAEAASSSWLTEGAGQSPENSAEPGLLRASGVKAPSFAGLGAPQCLSTIAAISSSLRLSKMPSLPKTTRSPR